MNIKKNALNLICFVSLTIWLAGCYNPSSNTTGLSVSVTMSDNVLNSNEISIITLTFSENIDESTFDISDITVENGSISDLTDISVNQKEAIFTPNVDTLDTTNVVTVGTSWSNIFGDTPTAPARSGNYVVNTSDIEPNLHITMDDYGLTSGETATITFTFSEDIGNSIFDVSYITAENGSIGNFTNVSGTVKTVLFTPAANTYDTTNIITVSPDWNVIDWEGPMSDITSSNYAVNTTGTPVLPTLSISMSDNELNLNETSSITFTFSEDIIDSTFDANDITVENGTIGDITNVSDTVKTALFVPTKHIKDLTNNITVGTSWTNLFGDQPAADTKSGNYTVDTETIPTVSVTMSDYALTTGETSRVTFKFSEDIDDSTFDISDITVENGSISDLTTWNDTIKIAVFTPSENVRDGSNVITVGTAWESIYKKSPEDNSTSSNYTVNTTGTTVLPTLSISMDDADLITGDTSTITLTFSEGINDATFTTADITVQNGIISTLTDVNETVKTAIFTPTSDILDTTNIVTVGTQWESLFGESPDSDTVSDNYTVDTRILPTVSILMSDYDLAPGETATITFEFSEDINSSTFTTANITVENGTIDSLLYVNSTKVTATFTPNEQVNDETNIITVDTNWKNISGEQPRATTSSNNYKIDTRVAVFTVSESTLIKTILSVYDDTESPILDVQGEVNSTSPLVYDIEYTVSNLPYELEDGNLSVAIDSNVTQDGEEGIIATLSWESASLAIGTGTISATLTIDDMAGNNDGKYLIKKYSLSDKTPVEVINITDTVFGNIKLYADAGIIGPDGLLYKPIKSERTEKIWLDRDLGAKRACTYLADPECLGDLYQWGRAADGHQKRTSSISGTAIAWSLTSDNSSFIAFRNIEDWSTNDTSGNSRAGFWGKSDGTGICPRGYIVPSYSDFYAEGNNIYEYFASIKVSTSAERYLQDGTIRTNTKSSGYWTRNHQSSVSYSYNFVITKDKKWANASGNRASGIAVRCIKAVQ